MTKREAQALLERRVRPDFPQYQVHGDMARVALVVRRPGRRRGRAASAGGSGEFEAALDTDRAREVRAYGLIYEGDRAHAELDLANLADLSGSEKPFKRLIAERARRVGAALAESESTAVGLLDGWASDTRGALGLN